MSNDRSHDTELIQFMLTCSGMSLGDFFLARLNRDALLRKEVHQALDQFLDKIIENMRPVHLASFLRDHGAELMALSSDPPIPAPPRKADPGENVHGHSLDQRRRGGLHGR